MTFSYSQRTGAILGFSLTVFAAGSLDARAQETAAGSATGRRVSKRRRPPPSADPLSKPHWNGWGVDPSLHRFQPTDMAGLAPLRRNPPETKVGLRPPGHHLCGGAADDFRRARVCRQPEWKGLFARCRRSAVRIGSIAQASPFGRPSWSVPRGDGWAAYFGDAGANVQAVDALTGKELWQAKV